MLRMLVLRCLGKQRHFSQAPKLTPGIVNTSQEDNKTNVEKPVLKNKNKLVSKAFEKLKTLHPIEVNDSIMKSIVEATNLDDLLSVVLTKKLTRNHSLKLVSVLADWTSEGKIKTSEFENDLRFAMACRTLGSLSETTDTTTKEALDKINADLSTVLGVASDDQAAKLISNISLDQMIKVLSSLAAKKRRSTPLLRSLAYNISGSMEKLNIKQGADALYALASLSFHNEMLVEKICLDLWDCLRSNKKRAVVGSIITSLGLLRYKNLEILDLLSEWVEKHIDVCVSQDLISLVMTLAVVHHIPENQEALFPLILDRLQASGVPNPQDWLDFVWALNVLKKETPDLVASVLSPEFLDKIRTINTGVLPVPTKLKLLNINGVAQLRLIDYKGPLLDLTSKEWKFDILRSKEKQTLVTTVQETLLYMLPSAMYLGTNMNIDMGFLIAGECIVNSKMTPLPLFDKNNTPIDRSSHNVQKGIKVAFVALDYHDMTRGQRDLTGINVLCTDLIRLKGYKVATIDFLEISPRSSLVDRAKVVNQKLMSAIGSS
ncbi:FAST kinase domain-containing protein 4 [Homalodisca vitripennis]|uniref:FAST kinase domain-containing protein 4 n=1 Tax=Homalodisca vitripennis TaxID=197043 RepID=UPI001EEA471B|nr:FAST kinase domain-containing protein 4 [Homalodisca vitripennis]XP_046682413.1 FAST kinase domain-containing protein 4 [Homalodisca vitripennis]